VNITAYVKSLNAKTLVDIFNITHPETPIKKFTDRATAERRMIKIIGGSPDYLAFYQMNATKLKAEAIELPTIEEPPPPPPAVRPAAAADMSPHLNLRCPHCGYYVKSTAAMLSRARLTCPVDLQHGLLLTAAERGEKRGRSCAEQKS
jgi:hypothetical protein